MRSDSKASSAGSTSSQGARLGSFLRGAFAIRGASGGADGIGAPAGRVAASLSLVAVSAILAAAMAMILASSALAAETRPATGLSFGPDGAGGTETFSALRSLAIDQASGDVYAYDAGAGKVYKFDASGTPLTFPKTGTNSISGVGGGGGAEFQVAVAPAGAPGGTAGDIYVANAGPAVGVYSPEGEPLGTLSVGGETCGVATNPAGHVFTGTYSSRLTEFTPTANPVVGADKSGESNGVMHELCNVAAGSAGIYGFGFGGGVLKISNLADTTAEVIDQQGETGAVDPVDGTLYADNRRSVKQYDSAGNFVLSFGDLSGSLGVAVRHSTDRVYVADEGKVVRVFGSPVVLPPKITFARTASVGTEDASVEAGIRPLGDDVEYFIEYGTTTSYGQVTAPVSVGGSEETTVSEALTGLAPGTAYHWRIVAQNPSVSASGPDRAFLTRVPGPAPETGCSNQLFRSGAGGLLPDCRAYERVSPRDKNGNSIQHDLNVVRASADGSRFAYVANSGIPSSAGGPSTNFAGARVSDGWNTFGLNPILPAGGFGHLNGFDENVRVSMFNGKGIYVNQVSSGEFQHYLEGSEPRAYYGDAADDPDKFTFESKEALAPGAVAGAPNDYFFDHGAVTLVGRIPAGSATSCDDDGGPVCIASPGGAYVGAYNWQKGGVPGAYGGIEAAYYPENTTSDDGSKVIFTASNGQLYVREDDTSTVKVSASQRSTPDPSGARPASYMGATPDGSKILFGSCEKLTDDSTAFSTAANSCNESGGVPERPLQGQDLYEFDTATGEIEDLTVDHDPADPTGATVLGLVGASADGSYVYFVANGALGTGAQPGTCADYDSTFAGGECNLYLAHGGTITFIARLNSRAEGDYTDWAQNAGTSGTYLFKTARVSASGTVIFSSEESLTGYPNVNCQQDFQGNFTPCAEIYRYAPGDAGPACISCNPTGAAPANDAVLESAGNSFAAQLDTWILTRNISDDGKRVFFDSPDQLVAADRNAVKDVYEWEASGSGSCRSAEVSGGCLYLLSDGDSSSPSFFGDASRSGDDAFFFTDARLVPDDQDDLVDAYDARVGGGLAEQNQEATSPPCGGEACKGAATVAPSESSPGSTTFAGPTNQKEVVKPPCATTKKTKSKKASKSCRKHRKKTSKKGRGHRSPGTSPGNRGGSM